MLLPKPLPAGLDRGRRHHSDPCHSWMPMSSPARHESPPSRAFLRLVYTDAWVFRCFSRKSRERSSSTQSPWRRMSCPLPVAVTLSPCPWPHSGLFPTPLSRPHGVCHSDRGRKQTHTSWLPHRRDGEEPECVSKSLVRRHTEAPDTASHRLPLSPGTEVVVGWKRHPGSPPRPLQAPRAETRWSPCRAHLRCHSTPAPRGLPGSGRSEPPRPR